LSKRQLKKDIFSSSFYGCHFRKAKGWLKDTFLYFWKDNIKKISFRYFDTFYHSFASSNVKSPLDGRDEVQFLVFKNHTVQNKRCKIMKNFTRSCSNEITLIKYFFVIESSTGTMMKDNNSCIKDTTNLFNSYIQ